MNRCFEQGTPEWLEFRKTKITASDAAVCLNLSPYENQYNLWRRKLGLLPEVKQTEAMRRGLELEPLARQEFERMTGIKMIPQVVFHSKESWSMASLDGISECKTKIVEIKCGNQELHDMAVKGELPRHYFCQVQFQLFVTDLPWAYYASYRPFLDSKEGHMAIVEVERDDEFISEMIVQCYRFYRRLKEFDPPAPKHEVRTDDELTNAVRTCRNLRQLRKDLDEQIDKVEAEIIALSGGECVECDGVKVTYYSQKGNVDYSQIPYLKTINLEEYRKPPSERVRISV